MMSLLPAQVQRANDLAMETIRELQEVNTHLAAQVDTMKPKAEAFDLITASGDSIDMSLAAGRIAEALGISLGRTRLYNVLRSMGIVSGWRAYQQYVDQGYFKNHTSIHGNRQYESVRVTPKGLVWLVKRIGEWIEKSDTSSAFIAREERTKK